MEIHVLVFLHILMGWLIELGKLIYLFRCLTRIILSTNSKTSFCQHFALFIYLVDFHSNFLVERFWPKYFKINTYRHLVKSFICVSFTSVTQSRISHWDLYLPNYVLYYCGVLGFDTFLIRKYCYFKERGALD